MKFSNTIKSTIRIHSSIVCIPVVFCIISMYSSPSCNLYPSKCSFESFMNNNNVWTAGLTDLVRSITSADVSGQQRFSHLSRRLQCLEVIRTPLRSNFRHGQC